MKLPSCDWVAFTLAAVYLLHQLLPSVCLWPTLCVALLWGCVTLVRGSIDYSSAEYWCSRYIGTEQLYEWYLDYNTQPQVAELLRNSFCRTGPVVAEVLELGAGTSTLGVAMAGESVVNGSVHCAEDCDADDLPNVKIDAIDFCGPVIARSDR